MVSRSPRTVFTIGHSTRPIASFIRLLLAHGIERVVDVRVSPTSAHNPQYGRVPLRRALARAGIRYRHVGALGGHRRPRLDSPNTAWRNRSFRGYADHMQTKAFTRGLDRVIDMAAGERVVLMCAEGVPWRCHRSLIADALVVRGLVAEEITSGIRTSVHRLSDDAHVSGTTITYR